MYSRPLLPFRARPLKEAAVRPSSLRRTEHGNADADGDQTVTVKAARRSVKAQPVLTRRPGGQGPA